MLELLRLIETEMPTHIILFDMPALISDDLEIIGRFETAALPQQIFQARAPKAR
jgi:hypothetical protein